MSGLPRMRDDLFVEIHRLADGMLDGTLSDDECAGLDRLVCENDEARRIYARYLFDSDSLRMWANSMAAEITGELPALPAVVVEPETAAQGTAGLQRLPTTGSIYSVFGNGIGYFSHGWPLAYLLAAVVCGIGFLIGSLLPASRMAEFVQNSDRVPAWNGISSQQPVGRITGLVDCRFEKRAGDKDRVSGRAESTEYGVRSTKEGSGELGLESAAPTFQVPSRQSFIYLGDQLAIASGLLELTYDTGAKVILQGPCTYEVESATGGYLAVGRLVAKVENKVVSSQLSVVSKSDIQNPKSTIPNPQSLIPNPLFAVRTPTATVTDLGTEFGVEVSAEGTNRVCVFQGAVTVQPNDERHSGGVTLTRGQSVSVDVGGTISHETSQEAAGLETGFVRRLPTRSSPTLVSLADLVAGGDGFGSRNNWGINPVNGQPEPNPAAHEIVSSGHYQRYNISPQIDGVFIPKGGRPEVVDSAGHQFAFPATSGMTYIAVRTTDRAGYRLPPELTGQHPAQTKAPRVLLLHANAGITFDLAAIRAHCKESRPTRFQSVAASEQKLGLSPRRLHEVWVLVDGKPRFHKARFCAEEGPVEIDIPLSDSDRFLTLVTTDGGDTIDADGVGYHDAYLLLKPIATGQEEE